MIFFKKCYIIIVLCVYIHIHEQEKKHIVISSVYMYIANKRSYVLQTCLNTKISSYSHIHRGVRTINSFREKEESFVKHNGKLYFLPSNSEYFILIGY